MASLLDRVNQRRRAMKRVLLTATVYHLKRVLVDDGGGTQIEEFRYIGFAFKGRLQSQFRRPDENRPDATGYATIDFADLCLVYPYDVKLEQEDRIQVNDRVYTIRNLYDNIDDAMTNQAYVVLIPGVVPDPPLQMTI